MLGIVPLWWLLNFPSSWSHLECLSKCFVHEADEEEWGECPALPEEEWGECPALPDNTGNLELLRGPFGGLDLAPCVGVHFTDDVNGVTGHLVVPQDGNECIAIH